jgi:hypothetical protein
MAAAVSFAERIHRIEATVASNLFLGLTNSIVLVISFLIAVLRHWKRTQRLLEALPIATVRPAELVTMFGAILFRKYASERRAKTRALRPSQSLSKLMAAIFVVGACFGLAIMGRRSYCAYRKAEQHAQQVGVYQLFQGRGWGVFNFLIRPVADTWNREDLEYLQAMERYHERMSQRYYDLALHPWRAASPDPPAPKLRFHTF